MVETGDTKALGNKLLKAELIDNQQYWTECISKALFTWITSVVKPQTIPHPTVARGIIILIS